MFTAEIREQREDIERVVKRFADQSLKCSALAFCDIEVQDLAEVNLEETLFQNQRFTFVSSS